MHHQKITVAVLTSLEAKRINQKNDSALSIN